ncbi:hypothetical protein BB561_000760 [Smittium simulii]|uniref:Uncharacterized protein n=1 Tax=Smittium simulii TaxID=133385 RepID=A0A2T9YXQ5_9FUNG|nr:hypothetical protein BB561_000760 [Smittium simulii]
MFDILINDIFKGMPVVSVSGIKGTITGLLFANDAELSLTGLNIKTAVARTRAFGKWASLRTWISDLIKTPYKHRLYTELKKHINYVFKIRNGTYWTARRYAKYGFIKKRFSEDCQFCRNIAPETIEHMLLECSQWQALRADILAQYINIYRAQVATKPPLLPASISLRLVGKLLGEELKLSSTRIRKDPTVLCVKTTLATAKFLNAIALPHYLMLNNAVSRAKDRFTDNRKNTNRNLLDYKATRNSQLISKIYRGKCPCCNVNVTENIDHILLYYKRWAAIRSETIGQFIPRLFRICNDNNNEPLTQAKIKLM